MENVINETRGFGKIVDDLSVSDLQKYEERGISILLVQSPLSEEVSKMVNESSIHVYADLDPETVQMVLKKIREGE